MNRVDRVMLRYNGVRLLLMTMLLISFPGRALGENWPAWRGPRGDGTSLEKSVPVRWSATDNVLWKVPIPGKGHASPIVWGDHLFVVTAIEDRDQRVLLCLNRKDGRVIWRRVVLDAPLEKLHALNSRASGRTRSSSTAITTDRLICLPWRAPRARPSGRRRDPTGRAATVRPSSAPSTGETR